MAAKQTHASTVLYWHAQRSQAGTIWSERWSCVWQPSIGTMAMVHIMWIIGKNWSRIERSVRWHMYGQYWTVRITTGLDVCMIRWSDGRTLNPAIAGEMVGCTRLRPMHEPWTSLVPGNESPSSWIWNARSERTCRQGVKIFDTQETYLGCTISIRLFHFRVQYRSAFSSKEKNLFRVLLFNSVTIGFNLDPKSMHALILTCA